MSSLTDYELLLNLLDNSVVEYEDITKIKIDMYLTLLLLNNNNYEQELVNKDILLLEDYLRKTNNLKVKIQLHRKDSEIDKLLEEIINMYNENKTLIEKYNVFNIDIVNTLNSKDAKELTSLIDSQTKEKMSRIHNQENYDNIRNTIIDNINNLSYQIDGDKIVFYLPEEYIISINDFKNTFDYLLNIDSYKQPLLNNKANRAHTIMIADIIKKLLTIDNDKEITVDMVIPLCLNKILGSNNSYYNYIDVSYFKIENIKITDLYKEADNKNIINNNLSAKWQKVSLSNEFFFNKLKAIISKGLYYYIDNNIILDNIDNNQSDFRVSTSKENMVKFLKSNLEYLINEYKVNTK